MIERLNKINSWFDSLILEIVKPLSLAGFAMGTVDIFTRGGALATTPIFTTAWAIVQAVTIDSLFFTVWYRLFGTPWTKETWKRNICFLFIGCLLALVVAITNSIISLQQLWSLPTTRAAMDKLQIDPNQFTLIRSCLVVCICILSAYVYRNREVEQSSGTKSVPSITVQNKSVPSKSVPNKTRWWNKLLNKWNNRKMEQSVNGTVVEQSNGTVGTVPGTKSVQSGTNTTVPSKSVPPANKPVKPSGTQRNTHGTVEQSRNSGTNGTIPMEQSRNSGTVAMEQRNTSGGTVEWNSGTMEQSGGTVMEQLAEHSIVPLSEHRKNKARELFQEMTKTGTRPHLKIIAEQTGVPYSTIRKWSSELKTGTD